MCVCAQSLSQVQLFATPWAVGSQAPLSMEFSIQEYWSGLPLPTPGDLPGSGNQTCISCVSCIDQQIFYHCISWEAPSISFSSVQSLSCVRLFETPQIAAHQASLSITKSWSLPKLMSIELVMPFNHLILCCPLLFPLFSSHLQFFPASGSFPMSQFFASGGQNIGVSASASVLPVNIQD